VHALRNIHRVLVPGAVLVDTQPVSARPPVTAGGVEVGTLDMRDWVETVGAVDALIGEALTAGLFELRHEERFVVADTFDSGPECVETVGGWRGTRVPRRLASRMQDAEPPVTVAQEVRLRLLERLTQ
jgi:hypothetical protein